jgi:hypothetical protein
MSVFIKTHAEEVLESKNSIKDAKSRVIKLSGSTREFIDQQENYARALDRSSELLTQLRSDVFRIKNMLPEVPENIISSSQISKLSKIESHTGKRKEKNYHEELKNLRKTIGEL